jgi:RNA polymerase sigma-70 factor, ECF subfamily
VTQLCASTHTDPPSARTFDDSSASSRGPLEPDHLADHVDALYRAACALCGSRHDAEDLVQETFAQVLKKPRFVHRGRELGYLLRALRNTYYSGRRTAARRPRTVTLHEHAARATPEPTFTPTEIMQAVASAPARYRDAVIAVDIAGLSYREAARALRAGEATITTRVYRGRQHIAQVLLTGGATK